MSHDKLKTWNQSEQSPAGTEYSVPYGTDVNWLSTDPDAKFVVDPDTGGVKGQKLARFASIPPDVLWELAEHYGYGQSKYPDDPETGLPNWMKGYDWRLNVDALHRHMSQWQQGEDFDDESCSSHLIAVAWHALTLRWFQIHAKGRDYR